MDGGGWRVFGTVFVVVLGLIGAGYYVLQTYTPPVSATAPLTPEVRQFALYLNVFEYGGRTIRHWTPETIVVNAGDTVILRITNTDEEQSHGFALGAINQSVSSIGPGETVTLRFVAGRPGIYHYGCTLVGCAKDHADQVGQFIVLKGR